MALGRRWVAAVALVLVAGGCADDEPQPEFEPSTESSATSSDAPSPDPALKPWEKPTEAGAVAFAKHWVDVFNQAQASGDTKQMRALSSKACRSCNGFANQLEDLYSNGGHLESDGWRVIQAVGSSASSTKSQIVSLRIKRSPQAIHRGDGGEPDRFAGGLATFSGHVAWHDGWSMKELELLE